MNYLYISRGVLFLLVIVLFACRDQNSQDYDSFVKKAAKDHYTGYRIFRSRVGEVDSVHFVDGQREGTSCTFINDTLYDIGHYKSDQLDGVLTIYFPSGKIKETSFWVKDKPFGDNYSYYENGRIKEYRCYNYFGKNCRLKEYDSVGVVYNNVGAIICSQYWNSKNSIFSANKDVEIHVIVSRPPNERVNVWFVDKWGKQYYKPDSCVLIYRKRYPPGEYPLTIYGESTDTLLNITKHDTSQITIKVK